MENADLPWLEICNYYGIGSLKLLPQQIPVHSLHTLWRIVTSSGIYALKHFNAAILQIADANMAALDETQIIARYLQLKGIPVVPAIRSRAGYTQHINAQQFMLMPWVEGITLNRSLITVAHVQRIGQILAKIHQINMESTRLPTSNYTGFTPEHWQDLQQQLVTQDVIWAHTLVPQLTDINTVSELAYHSEAKCKQQQVISHRDLDAKNIIWQSDQKPRLLDWDYAGLINPSVELLAVAFNWSNMMLNSFQENNFKALLSSYRVSHKKNIEIAIEHLYGYYAYVLSWIEWNLRRAILIPAQQILAYEEITNSLTVLRAIHHHEAYFLKICQQG